MNTGPTYDVFLSYNSLDRQIVTRVAQELADPDSANMRTCLSNSTNGID